MAYQYRTDMWQRTQKEFLVGELNRFTTRHHIHPHQDDSLADIEELSQFSLRRKRAILLEAITWCVVLLVSFAVVLLKKKTFDTGSWGTFAVLMTGSFALLLRAMYALGRNRKFRMIVKLLRLHYNEKAE